MNLPVLMKSALDPAARAWLLDNASLTTRLKQCCSDGFSVQVTGQRYTRPEKNESLILGQRYDVYCLVREVYLMCHTKPLVYARTVIPLTTLTGAHRRLARLGNRPLGAYLFADASMQRGCVQISCIRRGERLFDIATKMLDSKPDCIQGRRSVFFISGKALLVSEIFLPDIYQFTCDRK